MAISSPKGGGSIISPLVTVISGLGPGEGPLMAQIQPDGSLFFGGNCPFPFTFCQDKQDLRCPSGDCVEDAGDDDPIIVLFGEDNDNQTVTVRDRDSMKQERISLDKVSEHLKKII